jgi:hypothetical protein
MKKYIILVLIVLLIGALFVVVLAAPGAKVAHLYLYEKEDDGSCDWPVVDGAWGKMKYNLSGDEFEFVFNGHGLDAGVDYTLIYYPDPWPGTGLLCLGSGIANGGGEVHIAGSYDTDGDLPTDADDNSDPDDTTYCNNVTGAKIWLIPTSDVNCAGQTMSAWNHATDIYLFEAELINFDDTDD